MDTDYIDEVFEADAPQYVNFEDLQQCHDLHDKADDWFNYSHNDHEAGGIPIEYEEEDATPATEPEEYHDCPETEDDMMEVTEDDDLLIPPAPLSMSELMCEDNKSSPALPLQKSLAQRLHATMTSSTNEGNIDTSSPAMPLQKCPTPPSHTAVSSTVESHNATTDSPAMPLQKPPVVVGTSDVEKQQNNLDLIRVSDEGTRTQEACNPQTAETKPVISNIVTSWDHIEENMPKTAGLSKGMKIVPKKAAARPKMSNHKPTLVKRVNRSMGPSTASKASTKPNTNHMRRSAGAVVTGDKPTAKAPVSQGLHRSNSLRRSTRSIGKSTPVRSRSLSRRSAETTTDSRRTPSRRTPSVDSAFHGKRKRTSSPAPLSRKSPRIHRNVALTMPHTPAVMKRNMNKPAQSKFKSSEEIEMERIKQKRLEAEKMLKLSKKSHRKAAESMTYHPVRSTVEPTRPKEFKFETDGRIKDHSMETRQDSKDFVHGLRKYTPSPTKPKGPTMPNPFHFNDNSRKRHNTNEDVSDVKRKYKPMALQINEFHKKTPDRFRTRAARDIAKGPIPVKAVHQKTALTCPKTPALETKSRKRQVTALSAAEKEELEIQEMKKYNFRARPVNPLVMSNLNLGVKRSEHKEPTKAVGFNFESDKRMLEKEASKKPEEKEEPYEFHARPLNPRMLEGPIGIAPAETLPITHPKSPAFALKNRVRVTRSAAQEKKTDLPSRIVRANPVPHTGVPFVPTLPNHGATRPEPFSFDNRDRQTAARKEAKITEVLEEEKQMANQFKAQPLRRFDQPNLPEKKAKPATKPQPFMSVEERGARQAEQWGKKVEEELNEQRRQANSFRAKPAEVLYENPFIPAKSSKALTDVSDFELNTDRRAVERQGFEERKHAREAEIRVVNEERKRAEEEEEREAIERLRKETVHKANPIQRFRPVNVLPSQRPLTTPATPHFETDRRLRNQPRL